MTAIPTLKHNICFVYQKKKIFGGGTSGIIKSLAISICPTTVPVFGEGVPSEFRVVTADHPEFRGRYASPH